MKILTEIRLLTDATALLPLTATAFAYPSLANPRFSGAVALPPRPRAELLYRQADDALYEAKRNGRNRLYYYDESADAAGLPAAVLA